MNLEIKLPHDIDDTVAEPSILQLWRQEFEYRLKCLSGSKSQIHIDASDDNATPVSIERICTLKTRSLIDKA